MWNYVLKNLIILDRCTDEKLFLWDISDVELNTAKHFKDKDPNINEMMINYLI